MLIAIWQDLLGTSVIVIGATFPGRSQISARAETGLT
jgi:hypothetical protein